MKLNIIVILILANAFVWQGFAFGAKNEVDFLDVGQGDAILIQKERTQVLIDAGKDADVVHELSKVLPKGDQKIEAIIMTHSDLDHYGGFTEVLERYEIGAFISTGQKDVSPNFLEFDEALNNEGLQRFEALGGQNVQIGEIELNVFYPFRVVEDKNKNLNSLVVKLEQGGKSFMLTGDLESRGERLVSRYYGERIRSDVLKVGHHGSKTSSSQEFIHSLKPEYSIIQVGKNSYGHPTELVLERLKATRILRNDKNGTIRFIFKEDSFEIETEKQ